MTLDNQGLLVLAKLLLKARKVIGVIDGNKFISNSEYAHEILTQIEKSEDHELMLLAADIRLKLNMSDDEEKKNFRLQKAEFGIK